MSTKLSISIIPEHSKKQTHCAIYKRIFNHVLDRKQCQVIAQSVDRCELAQMLNIPIIISIHIAIFATGTWVKCANTDHPLCFRQISILREHASLNSDHLDYIVLRRPKIIGEHDSNEYYCDECSESMALQC